MSAGSRGAGRKDWVDVAKGLAIVLVVLYHSVLFLAAIDFPVTGLGRVKTVLEFFPMPVFLFIAGLFHFRVLQWSLADTWRRRLLGYLYLYLVWSVLRFGFYLTVPNVRSGGDGAGATATDPVALLLVLVWPASSYWYLLALAVMTLALWAVRRLHPAVPLAVAAALSVVSGAGIVGIGNVGWDRSAEYLVFFLAGAFFSKRAFDAIATSSIGVVVASGALYAALGGAAAFVRGASSVPGLSLAAECAAVVFGVTLSVRLARLRAFAWVSYLGARSLQIYLLHVFVIAGFAAVFELLPVLRQVPGRGLPVVTVLVTLVVLVSLLLSRLLDRAPWLLVPPRWLVRRITIGRTGVRSTSAPGTRAQI